MNGTRTRRRIHMTTTTTRRNIGTLDDSPRAALNVDETAKSLDWITTTHHHSVRLLARPVCGRLKRDTQSFLLHRIIEGGEL